MQPALCFVRFPHISELIFVQFWFYTHAILSIIFSYFALLLIDVDLYLVYSSIQFHEINFRQAREKPLCEKSVYKGKDEQQFQGIAYLQSYQCVVEQIQGAVGRERRKMDFLIAKGENGCRSSQFIRLSNCAQIAVLFSYGKDGETGPC